MKSRSPKPETPVDVPDALRDYARSMPPKVREYFKQMGSSGGKKRAETLTDERRTEIARKAAEARWGKKVAAKAEKKRRRS